MMLFGSLFVLVLQASPTIVAADIWKEIDPSQVCSTTVSWRTGIQSGSPEDLEERVTRIVVGGQPVWRVMHVPRDTAEAAAASASPSAHDVYDLDAATLRPLESEHRMHEGKQPRLTRFVYEIESDRVRKLNHRGETVERIDLEGQVPLPEGPGSAAIYQAIRWRDGLRVRASVVDRWRGSGAERLHRVEIRVVGRDAVSLQQRSVSTFVVSVQPDNHAYRILHHVTVERPHHIVRTEYIVGSRPAFISEVVAIAPGPDCSNSAGMGAARHQPRP